MSERDTVHEVFDCTKIGRRVIITRERFLHHNSGTGAPDAAYTVGADCDHKTYCEVCKATGSSSSSDWSKCVHPDLRQ
jgi:hypothetical protein